jgi:hypothetical protein
MSEKLQTIYEIVNDPKAVREVARTASGLLLTRCVDRRFIDIGGSVRVPGNTLGIATVLSMRGEAATLTDGIDRAPGFGFRRGGHKNVCAYDHNLPAVVGLVANEDPAVMRVYAQISEAANKQLPRDNRFRFYSGVVDRAQQVAESLADHQPDVLVEVIETLPGSSVVTPDAPREDPVAYVINTDPSRYVLDADKAPDGLFYLDSHIKAYSQSEQMPDEFAADGLAISAATAVLMARANSLPIIVASGMPGEREFTTLNVSPV